MKRIGRGGLEVESSVERCCVVVLRMNQERACPDALRGLAGSRQGVLEQGRTQSAPLLRFIHCHTSQEDHRNRQVRESAAGSSGGTSTIDTSSRQGVVANDTVCTVDYEDARAAVLLVGECVTAEPLGEFGLPAFECRAIVSRGQQFNAREGFAHLIEHARGLKQRAQA